MNRLWQDTVCAMLLGILLPGALLSMEIERSREAVPPETTEEVHWVSVRRGKERTEMDLEEYLYGVVLAEMPAYFEEEALKAQAVAARTYTWKAVTTGGKHGDGSVCTDPGCCQAYCDPETYPADSTRVHSAVLNTAGQVLTYGGELIEAVYFSCSGGRTEDAAAVWGAEFPYLQAVDSPGEENAAAFSQEKRFTRDELEQLLQVTLPEDSSQWLKITDLTPGSGVETADIGGKTYTGTQLRSLLGLRSTMLTVIPEEGTITVTAYGYGHRVGMSQYGADAMAAQGKTYAEILSYYYPGTERISLAKLGKNG